MKQIRMMRLRVRLGGEDGVTLTELIIVMTILSILATAAVPAVKFEVKRTKERELRADLWEMRRSIDMYKDTGGWGGSEGPQDAVPAGDSQGPDDRQP
jgi:general secretion pathway protein G